MDLIDRIRELGGRIPDRLQHIQTEEATKVAFVQPFIRALGYDVNDPMEVVPELSADIEGKKGEKVDYAIFKDGKPIVLVECKWSGVNLDTVDAGQLRRYFAVTDSRLGILTNGVVYRFFSDLEKPNIMDSKAFFELDLLDIKEPLVAELKKFTKASFDIEDILGTANELKYTREIKRILADQMNEPSDEFVRLLVGQVYSGVKTQAVIQSFSGMVKQAFQQFISDRINERLKSALAGDTVNRAGDEADQTAGNPSEEEPKTDENIVTTGDELEGYYIVKSILREVVSADRIAMRDRMNYCSVLLDDNQRKAICRLWFNRSQRYLGVFNSEKKEERIPIEALDDIYRYADQLKAAVRVYENPSA